MFNFSNLDTKQIEELRKFNQETSNQASFHWNNLANQEGIEFNKLLLTLATLIVPLSFIPISNNGVYSFSFFDKVLIICSWILLIVSIIFGAIQFYKYFEFHDNLALRENKRTKVFSNSLVGLTLFNARNNFNKMCEESNKIENGPKKASRFFLKLQIILLLIGVAIITFILSKSLLFS